MADIQDDTQNITLYDENGNKVSVVLDGSTYRLAVDANINNFSKKSEPVHESEGYNNDTTKISYTVPTGKSLYIQSFFVVSESDASGHVFALRVDFTEIFWVALCNDANTSFQHVFSTDNPYGPIVAGSVINFRRIDGSSSESWACGFSGFLEDS